MKNETLYFSTKVELKMNGVTYRPAMCYQVPPFARKSLQPFVDAGKVKFHNEPVHFVNGAIAHINKEVQIVSVESINNTPVKASKKSEE